MAFHVRTLLLVASLKMQPMILKQLLLRQQSVKLLTITPLFTLITIQFASIPLILITTSAVMMLDDFCK